MFDVAFSELLVIGVVALVVIGPEKLPKVARTLGLLAGRMQRYVNTVKSDIQREMQFQDLQKLQSEIQESVNAVRSGIQDAGHSLLNQVNNQVNEVQQAIESPAQPRAIEAANEVSHTKEAASKNSPTSEDAEAIKEIAQQSNLKLASTEGGADPTVANVGIDVPTEQTKATSEVDTNDRNVAADFSTKAQVTQKPSHPQAQLPLEPPQ